MSRQRTVSSPNTEDHVTNDSDIDTKAKAFAANQAGHFSMICQLQAADFITELNGFCGAMSIFSSLRYCLSGSSDYGHLWSSLLFMLLGLIFDFMDGRVARWTKKSSLLGQELDSLADLISFGMAPASFAFTIGFRSYLDSVLLTFFVLCGLSRLARFNVSVQYLPKDASGKSKYFEGTPIPTSLSLMVLTAYWVKEGWILDSLPLGVIMRGTIFEFHPAVIMFAAHGCAMVSKSLKVPKP